MNVLVKKAAVKKYAPLHQEGKTAEEVKAAIAADEKGHSPEAVEEIYAAIVAEGTEGANQGTGSGSGSGDPNAGSSSGTSGTTNPTPPTPPEPPAPPAEKPKHPAADIDYKNLVGENFKAYKAVEEKLLLDKDYDFEQYRVEVVMKQRFEGLDNSPVDMVGIRIKDHTPVNRTRIAYKTARELNAQVRNSGRYFLLKK